jgi:hypothetical protein
MYELDKLTQAVLSNSSCSNLNSIVFLSTKTDKHPIINSADFITFNTTDDIKINLSFTPQLISINNRKLTDAQAKNETAEVKSKYLHSMGEQLGMTAKLYQMKGKTLQPAPAKIDLWVIAAVSVVVVIFLSAVIRCIVVQNRKRVGKQSTEANVEDN